MKTMQRGFTLIELIVVIVILGILAASAIPKFVDLTGDAYTATAQGYAGALSSANSINYGGCAANGGVALAGKCVTVAKCSDLGALLVPPITLLVGVVPSPTVAKVFYLASDDASTATGATCSAVYGNGKAGGTAFTYTATTAG